MIFNVPLHSSTRRTRSHVTKFQSQVGCKGKDVPGSCDQVSKSSGLSEYGRTRVMLDMA
ncbi:hypothetical protein DPMN_124823 [Dreissena polymorpha]|uniref:Uncharacterized protein n=1 Tax=Dreissena polymorpha TaxID=45954 RepID=A0A9D4GU45_DREPO|nr:hypothetical protein DPMN_124823 [Dreissena polymorpha]